MTLDRKVIPRIAFIVLVIAFAAYCGGGGSTAPNPTAPPPTAPPPTAATVTMDNARFQPPDVTVAVGGTVTWSNGSVVVHTVTSNTNAWEPGPDLDPDATFQVTFTQAGAFDYRCTLHQGMTGTVSVQ